MHFPRLQDVNLEPLWEEEINHKLAIKHALLFSEVNGISTAIITDETLSDALNYFSKLSLHVITSYSIHYTKLYDST